MSYKTFETKRLLIRPTSEDDAEFILELLNSPTWIKYIGDRNVKTLEEAKNFIQSKILPQLEKLGYANYTVLRKEDMQKIGTCSLYDRDGQEGIDIGFAFLPEYEKKGYAFEAAARIKLAAMDDFGIEVIRGFTRKDNTPAQKLLVKLGFKPDGTTKLPGIEEEFLIYKVEK